VDDGGGEVFRGVTRHDNSEDKSSAKVGVQAEHSHLKLSTVTSDVDVLRDSSSGPTCRGIRFESNR